MSVPDDASECQLEPGVVQAGYKRTEQILVNLPAGSSFMGDSDLARGQITFRVFAIPQPPGPSKETVAEKCDPVVNTRRDKANSRNPLF